MNMITKALIEEKISDYQYKIRIPIIHRSRTSAFSTPTEDLPIATVCAAPNEAYHLQIDDVVFVAFEEGLSENPVIIGCLSRNVATDSYFYNTQEMKNSQLSTSVNGQVEELLSHASINPAIYNGVDLRIKFKDEIKEYSDNVWNWLKHRIDTHNYFGINVCDYILETINNNLYTLRIAGINTFTGYAQSTTIPPIDNHIDFISDELWPTPVSWNIVNSNNGLNASYDSYSVNDGCGFTASNLKLFLNSEKGIVPASDSDNTICTFKDYTQDGIYYYLPNELKNVIIEKYQQVGIRQTSQPNLLSQDNTTDFKSLGKLWVPQEVEICGHRVNSSDLPQFRRLSFRYPIFESPRFYSKSQVNTGDKRNWVLENAVNNSTSQVAIITGLGLMTTGNASVQRYVPICFRVGQETA